MPMRDGVIDMSFGVTLAAIGKVTEANEEQFRVRAHLSTERRSVLLSSI